MKTPLRSAFTPFNRRMLGLTVGLGLMGTVAAQAQTVYGLNRASSQLIVSSFVGNGTPAFLPITGVAAGQTIVGLDSRPATGELFALGYTGSGTAQLYTISKTSGAATAIGGTLALALGNGTEGIGFDFNPTVDRIRVTSLTGTNYRLNPNNGALAFTDGVLNMPSGTPAVGSVAYTNSFIGTATTTLYDVDESRSTLYIQNPPNNGTLASPVPITRLSQPLLAAGDQTDLDIYTDPATRTQIALLTVTRFTNSIPQTTFFTLDLATGNASLLMTGQAGLAVDDITFGIDRTAPAPSGQLLYALNTNNTLVSFYSNTPGYILAATSITGVTTGQTLVGTDFRPNNGQYIGLGYDATTTGPNTQLYSIVPATGVATPIGAAIRLELGGPADNIGFDFNPTVDRIRVVSTNRANYRLNPNNGALAATDGPLTYNPGDGITPPDVNVGQTPRIGTVGYTNSYVGSTSTTLYDIDEALSILATQNPPNAGILNTVGNNTGLTLNPNNALADLDIFFDQSTSTNRAFLTANPNGQATSNLYTLDLGTANPTLVGAIGLGIPVRDVAALIGGADASAALTGRLLYGVAGGNLVSFDSGNPGVIRTAVNITGLPANGSQVLVGTDFRPATGMLYALGYDAANQQGQLYTLNLTSGALMPVGSLQAMPLGTVASSIGFDFNPVPDRIRITSASTQANLRMNPNDGTFLTDGTLSNPNGAPALSAVGYTNNDNNTATGTTLYGYDQTRNVLLRSTDANAGTYVDQGATGLTITPGADFDIFADLTTPATPANTAYLVATPTGSSADNLYTVDLTSGSATVVGRIGSGSNLTGLAAFLTPVLNGITWTGAINSDWTNPGNWNPMQVPTATDDVTIPNVANDPVVSTTQQVNSLLLGNGATLTTADGSQLTLNGNFTNTGGSVLGTGNGEFRFSGSTAQTISGSSTTFNNLTAGPAGVIANAPVLVQRVLLLNGNLTSNGNLTLLSNATGTAHVVNNGAAVVSGTATVQRYIDATRNGGSGYRHYSAPVTGSTVADLGTSGFSPVVNPAYNTAAVPSAVTPFPTVFGYDETRVTTSGNPAPQDFDRGFFSPNGTGDALAVGRGYTVNIPAAQTVDFVGTLNNGTYTAGGLTRGTQPESGYHLRGNPYPSPIDWELVVRNNVDATVYVYRSTGQYAGTYSTYTVNGAGTNGGERRIASGQGFFVRASFPGTSDASLTFNNTARYTTYENPVFQRGIADAPLVRLDLRSAAGAADEAVVYFEGTATAGFDSQMDAYKLQGGAPLLLASEAASGTLLAVNALPQLTQRDVQVPLRVQAAAGSYTLRATELLRLPAGTYAYLRDAQTGTLTDLTSQSEYSFSLNAGAAATGRFSLLLTQQRVLANAPASLSQQVAVFPNPARGTVSVSLPASLARQATDVQLVNSLGQAVRSLTLPAGSTDARQVSLSGVAAGVYTLRLQTAQGTINKRLIVE
ncbi:DUF4394 domain-containing protein [Hymenobacter sp. APR13]|uniref:DUF4394 domain-containing protein n=1 Tax=Hymenobacter sp. APR13 TaxID=1356852 RepID=UPI0004E04566|nr:DUF4394 domain-containing protein [Hymenobacter sp. APR13]AII53413.1 hypothetical protein N008_15685 [Hymenobacter sp. APR13]